MRDRRQFLMDEAGLQKLTAFIKSFYRTLYCGPPIFLVLNAIFCYSFLPTLKINFFALYVPLDIFWIFICIYFPIKAIKRYNTLVQSFYVNGDNSVNLKLIDGQAFTINDYEIKDSTFKVGNEEKKSELITDKSTGAEYVLIPEFSSFVVSPDL